MVDTGCYNRDKESYSQLIHELYSQYPDSITLPPEYAYFVNKNLLQLLIRLARYKFVARLVKGSDHVLEVGSGSGLGSIFLAQHCSRVMGIDVKTTEVEEAKSINQRENVEFVAGDFFEMPDELKFDVIVSLDVIEHMPTEQGERLLSNMANHLKPSGMAIIGTPSCYSYEYQSALSKASHVKCYDQKELLSLTDNFFGRTMAFSMNDELVHTGFHKLAWYYFVLAFMPKL